MSKSKRHRAEQHVTIPFDNLILYHSNIGLHRGRKYGMRDVFGFDTLSGLPFTKLAKRVKAAYEGREIPDHKGWSAQREALQWLVDKGTEAIYKLKDDIWVIPGSARTYYLVGGNHRSLALYILGADNIRALVEEP